MLVDGELLPQVFVKMMQRDKPIEMQLTSAKWYPIHYSAFVTFGHIHILLNHLTAPTALDFGVQNVIVVRTNYLKVFI